MKNKMTKEETAYTTCAHTDPILEGKDLNYEKLKKMILDDNLHVVSFIISFDGFKKPLEDKDISKKSFEKVEEFIKTNDYLNSFESPVFGIKGNPKFKHVIVGFEHKNIDSFIDLIKKGFIEDICFWKERKELALINCHEEKIYFINKFNELLEKCKVIPGSATRELIPLMKKEYVPLIEDLFRKGNVYPFVAENLLSIIYINKYKLSDEVIEIILDGIIAEDKKHIGFIEEVGYFVKDKKYCPKLKKILEIYGIKKYLIERTEGFLYYLINTIAELGCTECIPKLKEISSYGLGKMNGRISVSTEEALEKLDKNYKSEYLKRYEEKDKKTKKMRIYWVIKKYNNKKYSKYINVNSIEEAIKILSELEREFGKGVISTWGGLEIFENGKWKEYKNDRGEDIGDIRELMNEDYLH